MQEPNNSNDFTPGQYVRVRSTVHEPWQVRIFVGWNDRRPGSGAVPYARVMLKDGFRLNPTAPTESFSIIEPWRIEYEAWFWRKDQVMGWIPEQANANYGGSYYYGANAAPFTLPPFIAPGDKY